MPEDQGFFLLPEDRSVLRALIAWWRQQRIPLGPVQGTDSALIPFELRRFVFSDALVPNSGTPTYAAAHQVYWDADESEYDYRDATFDVYDPSGSRRAPALNASYWQRVIGVCWKPHDCARWEILYLPHQAKWIEWQASGAFTTNDLNITVDNVIYHDGYEPFAGVVSIKNKTANDTTHMFEGDDDHKGLARYCPANDYYVIWQKEC